MSKEARIYRDENKLPGLFEVLQRVNSAYKGSFEILSIIGKLFGSLGTTLGT